jgi:UDP-N-acetylmuramoyl-tripeptide--D-alanyl-D-alanine ligase
MRGELVKLSNGAAVINDSYNSSPAALQSMTAVLGATSGYRRHILAAGEMRELGRSSGELHREAGQFAARVATAAGKIDWIVGVAGDAVQIIEGAVAAGLPREHTKFFSTSEEAAKFLAGFVQSGDVLLVKGSRGVKMERIVDALLDRYAIPGEAREEARH